MIIAADCQAQHEASTLNLSPAHKPYLTAFCVPLTGAPVRNHGKLMMGTNVCTSAYAHNPYCITYGCTNPDTYTCINACTIAAQPLSQHRARTSTHLQQGWLECPLAIQHELMPQYIGNMHIQQHCRDTYQNHNKVCPQGQGTFIAQSISWLNPHRLVQSAHCSASHIHPAQYSCSRRRSGTGNTPI